MFAGTPAVAIPALDALHDSAHEVRGVLTRPPAPVGRKRTMTPSPIQARAQELGLPVFTGAPSSEEVLGFFRTEGIECVAVVAYGALIREPALSAVGRGWVNLHFSLLPAWRGAAPVQHAIMAGEGETGVSTFQIEHGLDTGPVFHSRTEPIHPEDTAGDLLERLAGIGAGLLVRTLDDIDTGTADPTPQEGEVTLAPTLRSADGRIEWALPAEQVSAKIRGVTPAPGAWTRTRDGDRFKIGPVTILDGAPLPAGTLHAGGDRVVVGTGTRSVALERLAPPGKPWMSASDWARGLRTETLEFEVAQ